MDLSRFSMLSAEEERQAMEDLLIEARRQAVQKHLDRAQAACKKHTAAILALEEAERKEGTQAHNKEPRSIENSPRADLMQDLVKTIIMRW